MAYEPKKMNIVFYDGDCGLCNRFIKLILKFEKGPTLYFSPLDSSLAKELLKSRDLETVTLLKNGEEYQRSSAALLIIKEMVFPLSLLYGFIIIPRLLRDYIYKIIARNRKSFFRDNKQCILPTKELKSRFI